MVTYNKIINIVNITSFSCEEDKTVHESRDVFVFFPKPTLLNYLKGVKLKSRKLREQ